MAKALARDSYMQFKDISATTLVTDSAALVTTEEATGLSIRGMLIWLVHQVECLMPLEGLVKSSGQILTVACSTRKALAVMPDLADDGCLCKFEAGRSFTTSGATWLTTPQVARYLPPIPLATPALNLYIQTDTNHNDLRGKKVELRLGYTTAPLDAAAYTEVAEVWGW